MSFSAKQIALKFTQNYLVFGFHKELLQMPAEWKRVFFVRLEAARSRLFIPRPRL
jgi:hypothetical protein